MKILMINKFLYPKGGSETYILKLGKILEDNGHEVQYFGLENPRNTVGNRANAYVSHLDFSTGIKKNLTAPFRIIYSAEARQKIRKVLEDFKPDVVHLNNIQFHMTPSIILETEKYRKDTGRDLKIIYTAHDYQLICPSHGLFDANLHICEKCLGGNYTHCLQTKCVKGSRAKSFLGMLDAYFWKWNKAYSYIDTIICCSEFLKSKLDTQVRFRNKTVAVHNFVDAVAPLKIEKENYILEFGHLSKDKGTLTLLEVAKRMPETRFVFAGYGAAEAEIAKVANAEYVGFKTGKDLEMLIRKAKITVLPSEIYENCPFSVIESQMYGTPVVVSRMGGAPELLTDGKTGEIFEAGNADSLERAIRKMLHTDGLLERYTEACLQQKFETPDSYYQKLMGIYGVCMKIYEIGTGYTPIPARISAATEIVVEELTKAFMKQNIPVEIVDIASDSRAEHCLPIREVRVPKCFSGTDVQLGIMHKLKRVVYSVALAGELKKLLRNAEERVVLHFHNQYNLFFFYKLVPQKLQKKALIAYTNHSGIWRLPWQEIEVTIQKRYFQETFCMKKADIVFVLNRETKDNLTERLNIPEERLVLIGNGVNTDVYHPLSENEKQAVKKKWGLEGKTVILQVGSVYENKGQLRSLEYLLPILQSQDDMVFAYAGGIVDEAYQLQIQEYAKLNKIVEKVRYIGMVAPGCEMNSLYNAATATILPSRYEGFSLVSIESCASGIPVLMDQLGPISIGDGSIPFDGNDFNKQFQNLLNGKYLQLADAARKNAVLNYSWDKISHDYYIAFQNGMS